MKNLYMVLLFSSCFLTIAEASQTDPVGPAMVPFLHPNSGVVSIGTTIQASPYREAMQTAGTGFLVHKHSISGGDPRLMEGWLFTNEHVVNSAALCNYEVCFQNGQTCTGSLLFADPLYDIAVLSVQGLLADTQVLSLCDTFQAGEETRLVGNAHGVGLSACSGIVSKKHKCSTGEFMQPGMQVHTQSRGGCSGGPLLNSRRQVIGLNYASDGDTMGFSIHARYLRAILNELENGRKPKRASLGVQLGLTSLREAEHSLNFPPSQSERYRAMLPEAQNEVLKVLTILPGMGAGLELEDILWSADNQLIGPDLFVLDQVCNNARGGQVKVGLFRNGSYRELMVPVVDLGPLRTKRFVKFCGATFYESGLRDLMMHSMPLGTVMVSNVESGSPFGGVFPALSLDGQLCRYAQLTSLDSQPISSFEDLLKALPSVMSKSSFPVRSKNRGMRIGYGAQPYFSQHEAAGIVRTSAYTSKTPAIFRLDVENFSWSHSELVLSKVAVKSGAALPLSCCSSAPSASTTPRTVPLATAEVKKKDRPASEASAESGTLPVQETERDLKGGGKKASEKRKEERRLPPPATKMSGRSYVTYTTPGGVSIGQLTAPWFSQHAPWDDLD